MIKLYAHGLMREKLWQAVRRAGFIHKIILVPTPVVWARAEAWPLASVSVDSRLSRGVRCKSKCA